MSFFTSRKQRQVNAIKRLQTTLDIHMNSLASAAQEQEKLTQRFYEASTSAEEMLIHKQIESCAMGIQLANVLITQTRNQIHTIRTAMHTEQFTLNAKLVKKLGTLFTEKLFSAVDQTSDAVTHTNETIDTLTKITVSENTLPGIDSLGISYETMKRQKDAKLKSNKKSANYLEGSQTLKDYGTIEILTQCLVKSVLDHQSMKNKLKNAPSPPTDLAPIHKTTSTTSTKKKII